MSTIDKAVQCILDAEEQYRGHNYDIYPDDLRRWLQALADAGLLAPAPQIIRTVEELEALDPDTALLDSADFPFVVQEYLDGGYDEKQMILEDFPAVVVATGEHVRACREALEGDAE